MPRTSKPAPLRQLVVVLGDQLDERSSAFDGFDPKQDMVWMAEVAEESTHVWSGKPRIVMFLAAMRHFRESLLKRGYRVAYRQLDDENNAGSLAAELDAEIRKTKPKRIVMTEPGDYRVRKSLEAVATNSAVPLDVRVDRHFFTTHDDFARFAHGRKQLRLEFFYRDWRKKTGILMDDGEPAGGSWNYDAENRGHFDKAGPGLLLKPTMAFTPDKITLEVIALVNRHFADHPGSVDTFDFPVTRQDALQALADFIENRLPLFGDYQDAMWTKQPYLYHSRLSAALNLKLLNPREVVAAAENAYRSDKAPLASVEGFVRQILGWREYVRGIYWHHMPEYLNRNALNADRPLPRFYWTGDTDMACLHDSLRQTLDHGYAHHIQRLMVTGLFALLLGVEPKQVHEWYLAVYIDAVEWVELPNVIGMSQFADGGIMASKPYAATGKYIQKMSNYCRGCRYDPAASVGDAACPFTTLYWDFLMRHEETLAKNPRMVLQVRNLARMTKSEKAAIRDHAGRIALKMAE